MSTHTTTESYTVADVDCGDVISNGYNGSCGLLTEGVGQPGGVSALAEVDVDEVDAGGFEANESFVGAGGRCRKIAEGEDFRASGSENLNGLHSALDASGRHSDYL